MADSSAPFDVIVVGAGPNGLATALYAKQRGLKTAVLERGTIAHHIAQFPLGMVFFLGRWATEIGKLPLDSPRSHATREEVLSYLRRVVALARLEVHTQTRFEGVRGKDEAFEVLARGPGKATRVFRTRKLVLATGVYGQPRRLSVPGADLAKVSYGYRDPFDYCDQEVVLVGAGNGAAEAALRLHHEAGARVTVLNRSASIPERKWRWHVDDLSTLVAANIVRVIHEATLDRIESDKVVIHTPRGQQTIRNDRVIVVIGYQPDTAVFDAAGVRHGAGGLPEINPRTLETNVKGIYAAGAICAGAEPDFILICGGRNHGQAIVADILGEPPPELEDRGIGEMSHWLQFQQLSESLDTELALQMVPVVSGEFRDNLIDVYQHKTDTLNSARERAGVPVEQAWDASVRLGPIIDELPAALLAKAGDGAIVYKGKRLPLDALEVLRLADGTRRIRDIVTALAEIYDMPATEICDAVISLLLPLLREGRLIWRDTPVASR